MEGTKKHWELCSSETGEEPEGVGVAMPPDVIFGDHSKGVLVTSRRNIENRRLKTSDDTGKSTSSFSIRIPWHFLLSSKEK